MKKKYNFSKKIKLAEELFKKGDLNRVDNIYKDLFKHKIYTYDLLISCDRKINLPGFIGTNFVFCCISNAHSIGAGY